MHVTVKVSVKYRGVYIAPGTSLDLPRDVADELLKSGAASAVTPIQTVDTAEPEEVTSSDAAPAEIETKPIFKNKKAKR